MTLGYTKNKSNSMYFINIDGLLMPNKICEYLNISFDEYIQNIKLCNGNYSSKYGWFLPSKDKAEECILLLTLLKK